MKKLIAIVLALLLLTVLALGCQQKPAEKPAEQPAVHEEEAAPAPAEEAAAEHPAEEHGAPAESAH